MKKPLHQDSDKFDEICEWCDLPPKLIGTKVFLTACDAEHADDFLRFMTDETTAFGLGDTIRKLYAPDDGYGLMSALSSDKANGYHFMVWDIEKQKLIGLCSLRDIEPVDRTASLSINIGERSCRGKGCGTDAVRLLLDFGFLELDLHNIALDVMEFNASAIACYKKCGFKEIGRRRESHYAHGRRWDCISMDIIRSDYDNLTGIDAPSAPTLAD